MDWRWFEITEETHDDIGYFIPFTKIVHKKDVYGEGVNEPKCIPEFGCFSIVNKSSVWALKKENKETLFGDYIMLMKGPSRVEHRIREMVIGDKVNLRNNQDFWNEDIWKPLFLKYSEDKVHEIALKKVKVVKVVSKGTLLDINGIYWTELQGYGPWFEVYLPKEKIHGVICADFITIYE